MTLPHIQTLPFILFLNWSVFSAAKGTTRKTFDWIISLHLFSWDDHAVHLTLPKKQETALLPLPRSWCLFLTDHRAVCQSRVHTHKGHHVAWNELGDSTDDKLSFFQLRRVNTHTAACPPPYKPLPTSKPQANGTETIHTNASQHIHSFHWCRNETVSYPPWCQCRGPCSPGRVQMLLGLITALQPQEDELRGGSTATGQGEWLTWWIWVLKVQPSLLSSLLIHLCLFLYLWVIRNS